MKQHLGTSDGDAAPAIDWIHGSVDSADYTTIAYERTGRGPALILIDAAGHFRGLSSFAGLIPLLARDFTVYHYDRRGRGASGDTFPYAVEREIEDLAALIAAAGGEACLYGFSSGAALALRAAAVLAVPRVAALEPPSTSGSAEEQAEQAAFIEELAQRLDESPAAAVHYFLSSVGLPDDALTGMQDTPVWEAFVSMAPTLLYDCHLLADTTLEDYAEVEVPALVLDSSASGEELWAMTARVVAALPQGQHLRLPGEWHDVADAALAEALRGFFLAD